VLLVIATSATVLSSSANSRNMGQASGITGPKPSAWMAHQSETNGSRNNFSSLETLLGKRLFFDKRLSLDGSISCSTCHDPATAFADHTQLAVGVDSKAGQRNSPTILNSSFSSSLFSDGRAGSLEEQAKLPLTGSSEMGLASYAAAVARVSSDPEYRKRFKQVFGKEGITIDTIVKAIAAYERTLVSNNSPFDRFIAGDSNAISEPQKRGWELFKGKARCITCHEVKPSFPLFSDFKFHNTGLATTKSNLDQLAGVVLRKSRSGATSEVDANLLAHAEGFCELGRFNVTRDSKDIGAFKTPTLRDVELTAPYMHNGSIKTLIDVVRFYNRGGEGNSHLDPEMKPLNLSNQDTNDLVEFLRALTSDDVLKLAQTTKPQTRTPVNRPATRIR
jgi:cytochrome c peroxidase